MASERIVIEPPVDDNHKPLAMSPDRPAPDRSTPPVPDPSTPPNLADMDIGSLRLTQDFASTIGVEKALLTVPVRKPSKEWWVRTHPSYRIETAVLELKEDRETYLVAPGLWGELSAESTFSPRALFSAVNRQGVLFVWPVRLPGADGKLDDWSRSALDAAQIAETRWIRVAANMSLGAYEVFTTVADLPEPKWPEKSFGDILKIAFKNAFIATLDHPVLKRLRGEA